MGLNLKGNFRKVTIEDLEGIYLINDENFKTQMNYDAKYMTHNMLAMMEASYELPDNYEFLVYTEGNHVVAYSVVREINYSTLWSPVTHAVSMLVEVTNNLNNKRKRNKIFYELYKKQEDWARERVSLIMIDSLFTHNEKIYNGLWNRNDWTYQNNRLWKKLK